MSETLLPKTVSPKVKHYGRVPMSVLIDIRLDSDAVRIYGLLAASTRQGNVATVGMRRIGDLLEMSPPTVMRRINRLIELGHLNKSPTEHGKRAAYMLTSPVFGQKQRAGVTEIVSRPKGRRMVTVGPERIA